MILPLIVSLVAAQSTTQAYVPVSLAGEVVVLEGTRTDIGTLQQVFDGDPRSLARTPSLNPMSVTVEFRRPVETHALRLRTIDAGHEVTVTFGESAEELLRGGGETWLKSKRTTGATIVLPFEQTRPIRAMRLDLLRTTGDDFVHLFEVELCVRGTLEELSLHRVLNRREPHPPNGRTELKDKVELFDDMILYLQAHGTTTGYSEDVSAQARWTSSRGTHPFGEQKGLFHVRSAGRGWVEVEFGGMRRRVEVVAKPRPPVDNGPDLEVMYLERLPRIDFDGPNEGLPLPGQRVTWRGHVANWGPQPVQALCEWRLNGQLVATQKVTIPPSTHRDPSTEVDWGWRHNPARHDLTLTVRPVVPIAERIARNNTLTIQTDAITVGLWVERTLWDHMRTHQHRLPTLDANSFEGWAQRMVRRWNQMFKEAVFPAYPEGILERVRLDKVTLVPDFALPLAGGLPSNNPDRRDKTVDMTWGMETGEVGQDQLVPGQNVPEGHWWSPERAIRALKDGSVIARRVDPPFWVGLGYIHELNHARYLVDSYGFNVHSDPGDDTSKWSIQVRDDQGFIKWRYLALQGDMIHSQKHVGNMGGDYWRFSEFEAMCFERVRGRRARGGNYNSPTTIGEFLQEIPKVVRLRFVDRATGRPLSHAGVRVFQAKGTGQGWYTKRYENEPGITTTADEHGVATFNRTLWSPDGRIVHTFGHSNAVALIEVTYQGQRYYLFENVACSNLAYNQGNREEVTFTRQLRLRIGRPHPSEWNVRETWE